MNIGTVRKINAILCSVAILFFMIHAIMGTVMSVRAFDAKLEFLVWAGVALLVVHICMAVFITMNKKNDPNPPTKARHALQWITGTAMFVLVLFHMDLIGPAGSGAAFVEAPNMISLLVMVGLMIALVAHVLINLNGMFVDLGMGGPEKAESLKRHSMYMAVLVCIVFAALTGVLVFVAM